MTEIVQARPADGQVTVSTTVSVESTSGHELTFKSVDSLIDHASTTDFAVKTVRITSACSFSASVSVKLWSNGDIDVNGYSDDPSFTFNAERLKQELTTCDQHYPWAIRTLIFKSWPRDFFYVAIAVCFILLLMNLVYFFSIKSSRVNGLDPSLLISNDEYYRQLSAALKSPSVPQKLDVLLRTQIKGFVDERPILAAIQRRMFLTSTALLVLFAILAVHRGIARTYPPAFFALGTGIDRLRRLERKRDMWTIGVIVAFIVNIAAGLVLALIL